MAEVKDLGGTALVEFPADWWTQLGADAAPTVCSFDPVTGEFLAVGRADPSPLEPGIWLYPANTCTAPPPQLSAGFAAVISRDSNCWEIIADHRGVTVYSTATRMPREWLALGDLPEDYTLQAPTTQYDAWRDGQWVLDEAALAEGERLAASRRQSLSTQYATTRISTLQDAVDLKVATAEETAALDAWRLYRVKLTRLDTAASAPPAVAWPSSPNDAALNAWLGSLGAIITA